MITSLAIMAQFKKPKQLSWPEKLGLPIDTPREQWDYLIVDENGRTVWAKDLAARYRTELERRKSRDYASPSGKPPKKQHKKDGKLDLVWREGL